jgi:uncharacterized membrane protein required for colicin V production
MSKYLKYISLVIGIIGAIFFIQVIRNGGDEKTVGMFIGFTKWILILTTIIVLIYSIIHLLKNPKALKKALFSIIGLAILFGIAYMIADGGKVVTTAATVEAGSKSKLISAGIWFSIILGAIAFLGFIFDTIKTLIKS